MAKLPSFFPDDLAAKVPDVLESVQVAQADRQNEQEHRHHVVPVRDRKEHGGCFISTARVRIESGNTAEGIAGGNTHRQDWLLFYTPRVRNRPSGGKQASNTTSGTSYGVIHQGCTGVSPSRRWRRSISRGTDCCGCGFFREKKTSTGGFTISIAVPVQAVNEYSLYI